MAFCVSPSFASRSNYVLVIRTTDSRDLTLYCETLKDVRERLRFNMETIRNPSNPEWRIALSNGYRPSNVPAEMIKAGTKRYGRCIIASRPAGARGTQYIEVIYTGKEAKGE